MDSDHAREKTWEIVNVVNDIKDLHQASIAMHSLQAPSLDNLVVVYW